MAPTNVACCCRRCCLPSVQSLVNCSSFSKTVRRPAHRAHETVALFARETPWFISWDLWPSNSPDLNPVDYRVYGLMQEYVYKSPIWDVSKLRQPLVEAWSAMPLPQHVIDEAIDECRKRLRCCVSAEGGHFKDKLWNLIRHCDSQWFCSACTFFIISIMAAVSGTDSVYNYMHRHMARCFPAV